MKNRAKQQGYNSGSAIALIIVAALMMAMVFKDAKGQALPSPGRPGAIEDPRYCGEPKRNDRGRIVRSRAVLRAFAKVFPCPATLEPVPSCSGWAIDHSIPLVDGGCDSVANLTWLPDEIKSCASDWCKDRWERKYHAHPRQQITFEDDHE